jgi:hypothetical protein
MKNPFFYLLLILLVLLDGWLLAHPNLIGRFGVFFYEYDYLATFPKALGTVAAVVGAGALLAWGIGRLGRSLALGLTGLLLAGSLFWLVQSALQFTSGVYKLTGAGFRAGAVLLPVLLVAVFAKAVFDNLPTKRR